MSESKNKLIYPPLYLIFLLLSIYLIYRAFTLGLDKGEYVGKYEPETPAGPPEAEEVTYDIAALMVPADSLVAQGKELFNINCASCHGTTGQGDGPKSVGLNPPPRKFAVEPFKQGAGVLQIFQTLHTGVPGSSMASFSFMNDMELMSLAHYIRTFIPNPPADPPALVQQLAPASATAGAAAPAAGDTTAAASAADTTGQAAAAAPAGPELPIEFAIERMLAGGNPQARPLLNVPSVYTELCSACHGASGEGAVTGREFPHLGTVYARTGPLSATPERILESRRAFAAFLAAGIPGQPGHRFAGISERQMNELLEAIRRAAGN